MIKKTTRQFFLVFSTVSAPFSLAILGNFSRFWGRSFPIQLLFFLILDFVLAILLFLLFRLMGRFVKIFPSIDHYKFITVPFLFGLLYIVRLPIWQPPQPLHTIEIKISDDRNPQSDNSKVELIELRYGGKVIPFVDIEQQGAWSIKDGLLSSNRSYGKGLSYQGEPEYHLPTTPVTLTFVKSKDTGMVEISTDGQLMQKFDLFSETSDREVINLALEKNGNQIFVAKKIRDHTLFVSVILLLTLVLANLLFLKDESISDFLKKTYKSVVGNFSKKLSGIWFQKFLKSNSKSSRRAKSISDFFFVKNDLTQRYLGIAVLIISAAVFGLWFKLKQLDIIDGDLVRLYPYTYYIFSVFISLFVFIIAWLFIFLFDIHILGFEKSNNSVLISALPFLAFLTAVLGCKLLVQAGVFLIFNLLKYVTFLVRQPTLVKKVREPLFVLFALIFFFLFAFRSISPLSRNNPITDMWGRMDLIPVYESQWESAKAYDFTGMFTQKTRLGGNANGIGGNGEFLAVLSLIFDIPVVDLMSKYNLLQNFMWGMYLFGAFGMYLFLRYGLKLLLLPSLIGAVGFVYGNAAFLAYLGGEFFQHQGEYLFLPWIFLLLKIGHEKQSLTLVGLAGLVAALPEFVWNSHPEMRIISYALTNLYNIFLITKSAIQNHNWRSIKTPFGFLFIFPVFLFVGISFRIFHLADLILSNEYYVQARYRVFNAPEHLLMWGANREQFLSMLFLYHNPPFYDRWQHATAGSARVLLYTGQAVLLPIWILLSNACIKIVKCIKQKSKFHWLFDEGYFFLLLFILTGLVLCLGNSFPIFNLLDFLPINFHFQSRLLIYLFFFAMLAGVISLNFILKKVVSLKEISILFFVYLAALTLCYLLIRIKPDDFPFEFIFLILFFSGFIYFQKKESLNVDFIKSGFLFSLVIISFTFSNGDAQKYLSPRIEIEPENIFVSLRSAYSSFQNNKHDLASAQFIINKINDYIAENKSISRIATYDLENNNIENYNLIEEIDQRNFSRGDKFVPSDAYTSYRNPLVPLAIDYYNSVNFYLPISGSTFLSGLPEKEDVATASYVFALGKNFDVNSISHYGGFGLFQSISVYPYLLLLSGEKSYPSLMGADLYNYVASPYVQKIADLAGIDYIFYLKSLYPDAFNQFIKSGYAFQETDENLGIEVFKNPKSYGKAYFAEWIRYIHPADFYANSLSPIEKRTWPYSTKLLDDFKEKIQNLPNDLPNAVLIESDVDAANENTFIPTTTNELKINKILASKAVFEGDCKEDQCWLICNSAYLKGWKAFIDSRRVTVYRANLGFIGIRVPQGQHKIWLEYRPDSRLIGEIITLLGWLIILALLLRQKSIFNDKKK